MQSDEFKNRYGPAALITGASSGIGQSFARILASWGMDVVLVARRVKRLQELAGNLEEEYGVKALVCPVDLSTSSAAEDILNATGTLDIGLVVSNAGFGLKGHFQDGAVNVLAEMTAVNCQTPLLLARGFIPRLKTRGKGGLILTSSVEGLIGCPYSAAYSATKGFVVNLGEALWAEMSEHDIDVLTLCPGATDTEAPALQGIDPKTLEHLMSPDEVAHLALDNIQNGPTYIPSEHYRKSFDMLLSLPRNEALMAMASGMKPGK